MARPRFQANLQEATEPSLTGDLSCLGLLTGERLFTQSERLSLLFIKEALNVQPPLILTYYFLTETMLVLSRSLLKPPSAPPWFRSCSASEESSGASFRSQQDSQYVSKITSTLTLTPPPTQSSKRAFFSPPVGLSVSESVS